MEPQFECIKIKDGLYLGNIEAAKDYQFLVINKFAYIVNCSAQTPNHYESMGIKYLKFKLIKDKPHKLFNQSLKKLSKLQKFINDSEQSSMCCLITSQQNNMRSLIMIVAFLMSKFRWTLRKTLQYVRSKSIYISLNDHFVNQLQVLQEIINRIQGIPQLTSNWHGPYVSDQQQIISKTFLNSQEISQQSLTSDSQELPKQKKNKRVIWQDKIQKQQKRNSREQRSKQMKDAKNKSKQPKQNKDKQKERKSFINGQHQNKVLTNNFLNVLAVSDEGAKSKSSKDKIFGNKSSSLNKISVHSQKTAHNILSQPKFQKLNTQQESEQKLQIKERTQENHKLVNQKDLMKLIKNNLKLSKLGHYEKQQQEKEKSKSSNKKLSPNKNILTDSQDQYENKSEKDKTQPIYNLTINNFISPNIQILNQDKNSIQNKKKTQKKQKKIKRSSQELNKVKDNDKDTQQENNNFKGTGLLSKHSRNKDRAAVNTKKACQPKQNLEKCISGQIRKIKH